MDLTTDLEEASPVIQGCGAFSDVYKYKKRHANPPVFYAIKSFRNYYCNDLNKEKAEKVVQYSRLVCQVNNQELLENKAGN